MPHPDADKNVVRDFWDSSPCGRAYADGPELRAQFESQAHSRYTLEPYIAPFAAFEVATGHDVLEVGVGMGADHLRFADNSPSTLTGVDLSPQSVEWTKRRLDLYGYTSDLRVADAENLPFPDNCFSLVYSWGVVHHSPDTQAAVDELFRVLKPGGQARVMIYHSKSLVGYMLWFRYALLAGRPFRSLDSVYAQHLESPGTKAYTPDGARQLFSSFTATRLRIQLSFADMMRGRAGQQHNPVFVNTARKLWPRWPLSRFFSTHGLYLLIEATK